MSKQIVKCATSADCVRTTSHGWDGEHRDTMGTPFYVAECGGCGCRWTVRDVSDTVNAACARCWHY